MKSLLKKIIWAPITFFSFPEITRNLSNSLIFKKKEKWQDHRIDLAKIPYD